MNVAAIVFDDAVGMLYTTEPIDFSFVGSLAFQSWISFENEGIDVGVVD